MPDEYFDVLVIGAGIAGSSVAALLAAHGRVAVLERESQPGYHATGRSAALFSEIYGNAAIRALTRASREFLFAPPAEFATAPLVQARGTLYVARRDQLALLHDYAGLPDVAAAAERLTPAEARSLSPLLRPGYVQAALYEAGAVDIDVHGLHQGYLRQLRLAGGRIFCDMAVQALRPDGQGWSVQCGERVLRAGVVVNAAGAWADAVAALAGIAPAPVVPLRRTVLLVDPPPAPDCSASPLTIDIAEQFYFKPDAGKLLLSPADETASPACDAQPDDWDLAVAVDRIERATLLDVRRRVRSWAGLRSFAPDRTPVVGFEETAPGFFWLAGQGGYGLQTAPALAQLAAALILRQPLPPHLLAAGVDAAALDPSRTALARAG
ncbi:D-arginine dehydrogenase [Tahibacter aquaticus]|uniref:D-arginine dehydrogenase n=1 Tax=Tahibacter aquaticus TaxID=520092 RepID=A0A4V6PYH0_9GAMM|nr:FAD-dependent oxidoreductase [Tahibacter aquaticus]TDR47586.1 D-arginine dehydrogenase [Tahibacter aquaticus]